MRGARGIEAIDGQAEEKAAIIRRVSSWAGGEEQALAWYTGEPLPAFGNLTAEFLVESGRAAAVREYLEFIAAGGFA